ncbi:hypothetical protein [Marinicella rhabdoformis]|uniref:hypothetical protein n=1 Tax=Marinicella rhabdoformis TaxID=2580566 RepID=UPI0012AEDE5D|nr:hypothetical protein [Marinicella rhabdoformis]
MKMLKNISLVFVMLVMVSSQAQGEEDDFIVKAVKSAGVSIATAAAKKVVGELYKSECHGPPIDGAVAKQAHSLLCGALGSFSGETEAEWKQDITNKLNVLNVAVKNIEKELNNLKRNQEALKKQGQKILGKLDMVANEINITKSLTRINGLWDDQFEPLFNGEKSFTHDGLLHFAETIVFDSKIHEKLSDVHQNMTKNVFKDKKSWIKGYMDILNDEFKHDGTPNEALVSADFTLLLDYSEAVISDLIAQQTKGYSMYVWAAKIIEQQCEINQQCDLKNKLPHTAKSFNLLFNKHMAQQLNLYSAGIDNVVLDRSFYSGSSANFLRSDAQVIFARVDAFIAMQLNVGGLRGRVISMGDAWDGKLTLSGKSYEPSYVAEIEVGEDFIFPRKQKIADWWTSSKKDGVYDVIHSSSFWKVYHYHLPYEQAQQVTIHNSLPFKPNKIKTQFIDVTAKTVVNKPDANSLLFGSFTAIERAGGAYAFFSSPWQGTTTGNLKGMEFDEDLKQVSINFKQVLSSSSTAYSKKGSVKLRRKHPIKFAKAGNIKLNASPSENKKSCPRGNCNTLEISHNYLGLESAFIGGAMGIELENSSSQFIEKRMHINTKNPASKNGSMADYVSSTGLGVAAGASYSAVIYAELNYEVYGMLLGTSVKGFINLRLSNAFIGFE